MKKVLVLLVLIAGCSKKQVCDAFKPVSSAIAGYAVSKYECDADAVSADVDAVLGKLVSCAQISPVPAVASDAPVPAYKSVSTSPLCSLAPSLVQMLLNAGTDHWKCKKQVDVSDLVKKALSCS